MESHEFQLLSLRSKAPNTGQLLDIFNSSRFMTKQALEDKVCELALACCRLQQEVAGAEAIQQKCAKCSGSGTVQRWTGEYVECDACNARGY
jgi:hypothetical protein